MKQKNYYENDNVLVDWDLFGYVPKSNEKKFHWGTIEQLQSTEREDMSQPIKLKQIIIRKADSSLGGLKLVFDEGIETEFFDSEYKREETTTYNVRQDVAIKSVTARVNPCGSGTYINKIAFTYADDKEEEVFAQTATSGSLETKEIPAGHIICGLIAYTAVPNDTKRMHAFSFVLEKLPE